MDCLDRRIGLIVNAREGETPTSLLRKVNNFGLKTCQICAWNTAWLTDEHAEELKEQMKALDIQPSALWNGYSGHVEWNFTQGPVTLGIVPQKTRAMRVEELKRGARFAAKAGIKAIVTHCGFLPENMTDYTFQPVLETLKDIGNYCKEQGVEFWFETGQETPVALLRMIEMAGTGNMGINLDPANLLLYGKGNPIDALDVFGKYVRNVHVKDGCVPTDGMNLGHQEQVGKGMVNFPVFLKKLKKIGFDGEFIIEREIPEGEEQTRDIRETMQNLVNWWND